MKRALLATVLLCIGLHSAFSAEPPDEQFVRYYQLIQQADLLLDKNQDEAAYRQYLEAQKGLSKLQNEHPTWNSKVVQFRLDYVNRKLGPLKRKYPDMSTIPVPTVDPATEESRMKALREEIIRLRAENARKDQSLQDAMKADAAASSKEVKSLQAENTNLKTSVSTMRQQMETMVDAAVVETLKGQLDEVNKQLEAKPDAKLLAERQDLIKALTEENESLKKKVEGLTSKSRIADLRSQNSELQSEVVDLKKRLKATSGLEEKNEKLSSDLARAEASNKDMENLLKEERRMNNQLTRQLKGSEQGKVITELNRDNERLTGRVADLEMSNEELEGSLKTASSQIKDLEKQLDESAQKKTIAKLSKENESLKVQLAKLQEESIPSLVAENAGLKADVARLDRDLKRADKMLDSATEDLRRDLASNNRALAKREREVEDLEEKASKLEGENKALMDVARRDQRAMADMVSSKQLASLKEELRSAREALEDKKPVQDPKLIAELDETRSRLKEQTTLVASLRSDKEDLEKKLNRASINRASPSEVRSLTNKLKSAEEEKTSLEVKLARLEDEREQLESSNKELEKQLASAMSDDAVKDLRKDLERSRKNLEEAKEMSQALESENTALIASLEGTRKELKEVRSNNPYEKELKEIEKARKESEKAKTASEKAFDALRKDMAKLEGDNTSLKERLDAAEKARKADQKRIDQLETDKDDLEKKLREATKKLSSMDTGKASREVAGMADELAAVKAQLEAVNAKKLPYSKEELALFDSKPETAAAAPATRTQLKSTELPDSAKPLIVEAQRAYASRKYDQAESKYEEALRQSENNVFALANLAAAQIEQEKLPEAEKHLERALKIDPEHSHSLFQYGYLKYRDGKLEEALDYMSRAAKIEPENADVQNYLGIILSEMGQRSAAEAALRKAIQLAPGNASAHHNLAVIYATQKPPLSELAYWHYQKARDAGHPRNESLEKLIKGR